MTYRPFTVIKDRHAFTPEQRDLARELESLQDTLCTTFDPAHAAIMLSVSSGRAWAKAGYVRSTALERGHKLFAGVGS